MPSWSVRDKVILITGGAGGIGAATARELAQRGARLALADLDRDAVERAAADLPGDVLALQLDVTDAHACELAVAEVIARHGGLDVVWANAGIASFGPVAHMDPGAWDRTIEVNLLGAYRTVHAALPAVIERRGYVAVTASLASFAHAPGMSAYAASKAAVEAFCNALRTEVAHLGVDVASIHPAFIATAMVSEGDGEQPGFRRLRASMPPPFGKTHAVGPVAQDIVNGFERRARRICTPRFVGVVQVLRSALTTRLVERDLLKAAPDIDRLFAEEVARRGAPAASLSTRVLGQSPGEGQEAAARVSGS